MRTRRTEEFWLRLSTAEKKALYEYAEERDIPASQAVRQAIKSVIAEGGEPSPRSACTRGR
jgi:hypothetical protein